MNKNSCAVASFAVLTVLAAGTAHACGDGLQTDGSLLTGKTYKNSSSLPGVSAADAYMRALEFTMNNGFTVISANAELGQITAAQSAQIAKGKTVPLTILVRDGAQGAQLTLRYETGFGQMSPDSAVEAHFCKTFAAAADTNSPKAKAVVQGSGDATKVAEVRQSTGSDRRRNRTAHASAWERLCAKRKSLHTEHLRGPRHY